MILSLRLQANSGLAPSVNLINTSLRSSFPLLVKINIEADRASGLAFKQPVGCLCLLSLRGCPYACDFNAISSHNLWLTVFHVPMTKLHRVQGNPGGGTDERQMWDLLSGSQQIEPEDTHMLGTAAVFINTFCVRWWVSWDSAFWIACLIFSQVPHHPRIHLRQHFSFQKPGAFKK